MAQATWQRVQRSASSLSTRCVRAMEELPWFGALPPDKRAYMGLVVQNGVAAFAQWLRAPDAPLPVGPEVFGRRRGSWPALSASSRRCS